MRGCKILYAIIFATFLIVLKVGEYRTMFLSTLILLENL